MRNKHLAKAECFFVQKRAFCQTGMKEVISESVKRRLAASTAPCRCTTYVVDIVAQKICNLVI